MPPVVPWWTDPLQAIHLLIPGGYGDLYFFENYPDADGPIVACYYTTRVAMNMSPGAYHVLHFHRVAQPSRWWARAYERDAPLFVCRQWAPAYAASRL